MTPPMTLAIDVPGDGPAHARVAFVGEAPAKHELKERRPFVGPSGGILWPLVWRECRLDRSDVYVTNLLKIEMEDKWSKSGVPPEVLAEYGALLDEELAGLPDLDIIVPVGRYAARHFLGDWAQMQTVNGRVWANTARVIPTAKIIPVIHPAAAMRDASQLAWTQKGLETLGQVLRGGQVEPVPAASDVFVYDDWWQYRYDQMQTEHGERVFKICALDTEWLPNGQPWGLSFAVEAHRAVVVRANNASDLQGLKWWLEEFRPAVALHYALADLDPLRRMGIDLRAMGLEIIDTNILAFHQQTEPQGLKALARRWLGLAMRDYEDVVGPYHIAALKTYFEGIKAATEPPLLERRGKPTKKEPEGKLLKPKPAPASRLHKLVRGALRDFEKNSETDLAKRWEGWDAEVRAEAEGLGQQAPRASLDLVPLAEAVQYAGTDAAAAIGILPFLRALPQSPQVEVIDHGVIAQTDDMQSHGLLLDEPRRQKMAAYLTSELEEMREVLRIVVGDPEFNPDSRDDVAKVLFGVIKDEGAIRQLSQADNDGEAYVLPVAYTKTRLPATDKKSLALLSKDHVLPPLLLHYRQLQKIDSTYVRPLPRFVRGGVLHPRYSLTRVPSGRLAARDPNVMAFPKRSELGKKVRDLFPARPGRLFGSWDHKGIELRVMADEANDATMLEELQEDYPLDMHRSNAARFFGLRYEDVDPKGVVRDGSKILTFGIAYGAEPERLHFEALVVGFDQYSVDDFVRFRADWFRKYAGVAQRTRDVAAFTRQHGYILDRWGRRRYIPSVWLTGKRWPFAKLREEGERQAFNHTIQGGAQGFMKRAQIRAHEQALPVVRDCGYGADPVLQIHDNIVVEFDEGGWDVLDAAMRWAMTADSNLMRCPILTTSDKGARWSEI
jgi:uracil-DNA glycosylase family 4